MNENPVPVFTVKLYSSTTPDATSLLLVAARLEIQRRGEESVRINVLGEAGAVIEYHDVGTPGAYAWAVIENPSGRTTEVIRPRTRQIALRG